MREIGSSILNAVLNERGAIMGLQQFGASFARVTGPVLAYMVYDAYQGNSAFMAAALTTLIGIPIAFWVTRTSDEAPQEEGAA